MGYQTNVPEADIKNKMGTKESRLMSTKPSPDEGRKSGKDIG